MAWFNNAIKLIESGQSLLDRLPIVGSRRVDPDDILHFDDEDAPKTRFDDRISPHRVLAPFTFEVAEIEAISEAVPDVSLNDVVLAVCSGALRRYLAEKKELPQKSMYALVPLHVHDESDEGIPGHRVQLIRIRLMTDIDDPLERLVSLRDEMAHVKTLQPISADELLEMQDVLPSTAMVFAAKTISARMGPGKRYRENHNTVISIHPGPAKPLYLCGARLVGYTGMAALMDNLGLNHTATTYDGKLTIAPVGDRQMMPDPATYYECLRASFDELRDAVDLALSRSGQPRLAAVSDSR
jgi:WS/DGAT/MGAT family acyltransferase